MEASKKYLSQKHKIESLLNWSSLVLVLIFIGECIIHRNLHTTFTLAVMTSGMVSILWIAYFDIKQARFANDDTEFKLNLSAVGAISLLIIQSILFSIIIVVYQFGSSN